VKSLVIEEKSALAFQVGFAQKGDKWD